jgi:hypothetical protein
VFPLSQSKRSSPYAAKRALALLFFKNPYYYQVDSKKGKVESKIQKAESKKGKLDSKFLKPDSKLVKAESK